jgi:hypothetical protein
MIKFLVAIPNNPRFLFAPKRIKINVLKKKLLLDGQL